MFETILIHSATLCHIDWNSVNPSSERDSIKHGLRHWPTLGLPFGLVLAYLLAWLSHKAGTQEVGVRSQMSVVSKMVMLIGVLSNLMLVL